MGAGWVAQEYECSFLALQGAVYPDFAKAETEVESLPEGRLVGGIDFGWRNPFAALWGVLDRDDVLWLGGERYLRCVALHRHAAALKEIGRVTWYADPAGRTEIEELRAAGLTVLPGANEIRPGIAAVNARLQTGRLKVLKGSCPNLLNEAQLYRYPSGDEGVGDSESPIDADNHALAALRYLVSKIDTHFLARLRQRGEPASPKSARNDDHLWTKLS